MKKEKDSLRNAQRANMLQLSEMGVQRLGRGNHFPTNQADIAMDNAVKKIAPR